MKKTRDPSTPATFGDLEEMEHCILKNISQELSEILVLSEKNMSQMVTKSEFEKRMGGMEDRQDAMAQKIIKIEDTMATKEDIQRLESKMVTKRDIADFVAQIRDIRQEYTVQSVQHKRNTDSLHNHESRITVLELALV